MLFDARDQERIRIFNGELRRERILRLETTADPRSSMFSDFAADFAALAPMVRIEAGAVDASGLPGILIDEAWRYHAIPLSAELDPFLHLLGLLDQGEPPFSQALRGRLEAIDAAGFLQVFIAPHCPFCPQVVQQIVALPLASAQLKVAVIDGTLFPEMAQEAKVRSAPTVILDGEYRWAGQVQLEELVETLVLRDATKLDEAALVDMLKEGNATQLAQMMLRRRLILPAFPTLLGHAEWSVRLGAMVTMEEIADQDPGVAQQAIEPLWRLMESAPEAIRGDLIYLLGQLGDTATLKRLQEMLTIESGDELREVLEEALAALERKARA
jgi:thiol-disulfide isomerase/thioredoxin